MSKTIYLNMHGSLRLTLKQAKALKTVINLGLADCESLLHDGEDNGLITSAEHNSAQAAFNKLHRAMLCAEKKVKKVTPS